MWSPSMHPGESPAEGTRPLHRRLLAKPADSQADSLLLNRLPPEVRLQIYTEVLTAYRETKQGDQHVIDLFHGYTLPYYIARLKVSTALLRTCRAIYSECWALPWLLHEQTLDLALDDSGMLQRTDPLRPVDVMCGRALRVAHELGQTEAVLGTVRFIIDPPTARAATYAEIFKLPGFRPRRIAFTFPYQTWHGWQSDAPLFLEGSWVRDLSASMPNTVEEIRIDLETLERKSDQVREIAAHMANRWFFAREDGAVLFVEDTQESTWSGTSLINKSHRWVRDEVAEYRLDYHVQTVIFRPAKSKAMARAMVDDALKELSKQPVCRGCDLALKNPNLAEDELVLPEHPPPHAWHYRPQEWARERRTPCNHAKDLRRLEDERRDALFWPLSALDERCGRLLDIELHGRRPIRHRQPYLHEPGSMAGLIRRTA